MCVWNCPIEVLRWPIVLVQSHNFKLIFRLVTWCDDRLLLWSYRYSSRRLTRCWWSLLSLFFASSSNLLVERKQRWLSAEILQLFFFYLNEMVVQYICMYINYKIGNALRCKQNKQRRITCILKLTNYLFNTMQVFFKVFR